MPSCVRAARSVEVHHLLQEQIQQGREPGEVVRGDAHINADAPKAQDFQVEIIRARGRVDDRVQEQLEAGGEGFPDGGAGIVGGVYVIQQSVSGVPVATPAS